ncbi:MAG TPA: ester cyclase [Nitrososphaerales archaeon]|nr:ester cyclase [Nitrososphaerales archaeon]
MSSQLEYINKESKERNEKLVRRLLEEGFNKGSLSVVDELVATDYKEHQRDHSDGREGVKEVIQSLRGAFPDFAFTIEELHGFEDKVWVRLTARGTNLGSFMGRPPTGRKITVDAIDVARFKDGKMVEHWGVPDELGAAVQLGFLKAE